MKKKLTIILSALLLSGCKWAEADYNKLIWESKQKGVEIEILEKQITIDSLKKVLNENN